MSVESHAHVHGGPAVLDIGGDFGALVVTMEPEAAGSELFLRRADDPGWVIHTGVWRRDLGGRRGTLTAAVFMELAEGGYWILDASGRDLVRAEVHGGHLAQVDLASADTGTPGGGAGDRG